MEFGSLVRKLRKEQRMSIRELAEAAGISESYLSQIETQAKNAPSERVARKLAKILRIPESLLATTEFKDVVALEEHETVVKLALLERKLRDLVHESEALIKDDLNGLIARYRFMETGISWKEMAGEVKNVIRSIKEEMLPPDAHLFLAEYLLLDSLGREYTRKQMNLYKTLFLEKTANGSS